MSVRAGEQSGADMLALCLSGLLLAAAKQTPGARGLQDVEHEGSLMSLNPSVAYSRVPLRE